VTGFVAQTAATLPLILLGPVNTAMCLLSALLVALFLRTPAPARGRARRQQTQLR
jgi:hypothetical protein